MCHSGYKKKNTIVCFLVAAMMFAFVFGAENVNAAEGTPISTVEDLLAMEQNPSGTYYLANDIEVPANTQLFASTPFTGVLDGNGYKLTGYEYINFGWCDAGLFAKAKGATFKNLKMTKVNIGVQSTKGASVGTLVLYADSCTFDNVKISGKIKVNGSGRFTVGGFVEYTVYDCNFKDCTSDVKIKLSSTNEDYGNLIQAAGMAVGASKAEFSNCKNTGNITVKGDPGQGDSIAAVGITIGAEKLVSCSNTGNITVKLTSDEGAGGLHAAGIATEAYYLQSCSNTGKIKAISNDNGCRSIYVGGLLGEGKTHKQDDVVITKCYNKGKVTFSGKCYGNGAFVGGLAGNCPGINLSYNKGSVETTIKEGMVSMGGVCGVVYGINDCYNTGKVSLQGNGYAGGLAGSATITEPHATRNYNIGSVTGKGTESYAAAIFGAYNGPDLLAKCTIYDNYYTNGSKAYGFSPVSWKDWVAKANKVSKITKENCPKLTGTNWSYSSTLGRMILNSNKE